MNNLIGRKEFSWTLILSDNNETHPPDFSKAFRLGLEYRSFINATEGNLGAYRPSIKLGHVLCVIISPTPTADDIDCGESTSLTRMQVHITIYGATVGSNCCGGQSRARGRLPLRFAWPTLSIVSIELGLELWEGLWSVASYGSSLASYDASPCRQEPTSQIYGRIIGHWQLISSL